MHATEKQTAKTLNERAIGKNFCDTIRCRNDAEIERVAGVDMVGGYWSSDPLEFVKAGPARPLLWPVASSNSVVSGIAAPCGHNHGPTCSSFPFKKFVTKPAIVCVPAAGS